jgi:hypothetical protein
VFGLIKPKFPITPERKSWIDNSFLWIASLLGAHRLLRVTVILPTSKYFPDPYDRSEIAFQYMFQRVATHMQVDSDDLDGVLFVSREDNTREFMPYCRKSGTSFFSARARSVATMRTWNR